MGKQKAFVVGGGGMVGATAAYAMALNKAVEEIVLIDVNEQLVWGQAADINDAMGFDSGILVRTGTYEEIATGDIVVITAGAPQVPGQSRLELLGVNAGIIRSIMKEVTKDGRQPFVLMVANPVDVLTYIASTEFGLPKGYVLGTGTTLDTSRLRSIIADDLGVHSREVDAYILGEHGDSSFSTIARANVGDIPLKKFPGYDGRDYRGIDKKIRDRAYKVIETKKSTYYAIGLVISKVVIALRRSTYSIFPVCSLLDGEYGLRDVVLGVPSVVSNQGVKILEGYELTPEEKDLLKESAAVVKHAIATVKQQ
jgi:L-lactate dehydrogenase